MEAEKSQTFKYNKQIEKIPESNTELTRSGLLRTIEKKKKDIEDLTFNKTPQPRRKNDENAAKSQITEKKSGIRPDDCHSLEKPEKNMKQRSIIRGKILYENAMATLEKKKTIKEAVLNERGKNEVNGCSFSPEITKKASKIKDYVHIIQKTKESLQKIEQKRRERKEELKAKEIEDCTFSPLISQSKYQNEISPERKRMKMLGNLEFDRKKAFWQKELQIEDGKKSKPRVSLTKEELHNAENKEKIMEMILTPKKKCSKRRNSSPKQTTRSRLCEKCIFCQKLHEKYDNGSNEKIQCFLGYYGLTKSFVHQTPQKNKDLLGKSFDEAVQNYPRFDEYLSKSFIKDQHQGNSLLYRKIAETFQIFENFRSKTNDINSLRDNLNEISNKKHKTQEIMPLELNYKEDSLYKKEPDFTYSNETEIPFTKIKDLKYQRAKPFKKITTSNNKYIVEVLREQSTEETSRNSIKNMNESIKYHKTELKKLDSPYSCKKRTNSALNSDRKRQKTIVNESEIDELDRTFIRNYQKVKIFKDLKQKYKDLAQTA